MSLVLDAGALLAIDRRDLRVGAMLRVAQQRQIPVRTSAAAVAQVWRNGARQALLARVLAGVAVAPLDLHIGKRLGALLGATGTRDVVDAHVASLAAAGDKVLTTDSGDLRKLLNALAVEADLVHI
jgi:hypothetical protein